MCRKMFISLFLVVIATCLVTVVGADEILVYSFDEGSGTTAFDQTGNGRDGVISDATWQAGGFNGSGWALSFGSGAKVEDDDGEAYLNGLEALTMAAWVKSNILSSDRGIFNGETPDGGDNVCTMRYDSSGASFGGTNVMKMAVTAGGAEQQLESSSNVQTTEWQHVAMTWESGGLIRLYINGEEDMGAQRSGPNNSGTIDGCDTFIVGQGAKDQSDGWNGLIDEVRLFDTALTAEEIQLVMLGVAPEVAKAPVPEDGATDVDRDSALAWGAGDFAATHNVFLGTSFDDVNDATVGVGQGLADTTFDPGRLEFGQTYYWRVDEVNAAPDSTVFAGDVWTFMVEPFSIPITTITAAASSSFGDSGPEKTIDGSGLADDLHGTSAGDMWISAGVPATLEYAFDKAYKLHELWIWNSNQLIEGFVGFGGKDVVIEHSLDGENWTVLDGVGPLAQAPGTEGYAHNNTINFGGAMAQHVRLTVNSVQGIAPQTSLSEVRFYYIPTFATRPNPASGATDVSPDVSLAWGRDGREAGSHDVYVGTDAGSLSLAGSVSESSFDTLAVDLQLSQTYYWRVDEVNDAMDPSTWTGDVWSFTTVDAIVIDDMESYADAEFLEIWATWVDGFDDPANNGSLVGGASGTPETDIVHGGSQSLPIDYDNGAAAQSEATRTFAISQDWTRAGVTQLVVWFHGTAGNTGQLYLKVNGTKIPYDGPAGNIALAGWQVWNVDLASLGMNLQSVRSLTVGIEGNGATGTLYIDDIVLVQSAAASINAWRVSAGSDDAEEHILDGGVMESLTSSDLELGYEGNMAPAALQTIGCRWVGIAVPRGATITEAWVQFSADDIDNPYHVLPVSLVIVGQLSPNPETFVATAGDISSRPTTSAQVVWDIPQWMTVHAMGPEERTPDISSIIQEIVNQPGWSGEGIVLMFGDNPANPSAGTREAESFNGSADDAPLLHISFE